MGSGAKKKGARKNKTEGGLFIAIFTSHRSPLSERLEQANLFIEVQLLTVIAVLMQFV